jgi:signal peptidase II
VRSDAGSDGREPGRARRPLLALGIVVAVVAADQLTKAWVVATFSDRPLSIVGTTVELRLSRNPGSAFSLFQAFTPLLAVIAVLVAVVLVRAVRRTDDPVMVVALSLVLAGALGNLGDRVFRSPSFLRGEVVDFVRIGAWPSFNVADSAITIGAVLLIVWGWRRPSERTEQPADTPGGTR